jgi:CO/xanthine dehydrogenase Mo-binding subunit
MPTSLDAPHRIQSVLLETPEESGPFGARGIAEMCLSPTAPAIANAVYDAIGRRVKSIPIKPDMLIGEKTAFTAKTQS